MIELRTKLELYDAQNALFNDVTGNTATYAYDKNGNIDQTDVSGIRLLLGNYSTLSEPTTLNQGELFLQYHQYVKTSGATSVIQGKSFDVGALFVPQFAVNNTVPNGDVWQTTGYYVPLIGDAWIPTSAQVALNLNVTELGGQANSTIDANMWAYEYEIYNDPQTATFTPTIDTQYMVVGGDLATYNGGTYYKGEVIVTSNTNDIVPLNFPNTTTVAKLYGTAYSYAPLLYTIKTQINDVIERLIGKNNQDLVNIPETEVQKIRNTVESLEYAAFTGNVSMQYCYETIQFIQSRLTLLLNQ